MVGQRGGGVVLDERERTAWSDIVRQWSAEGKEPDRDSTRVISWRRPGDLRLDEMPVAVVVGLWLMLLLLLVGAVSLGLTVGGITALGWWLWRRAGSGRSDSPDGSRR
jgi:hypothetical protein